MKKSSLLREIMRNAVDNNLIKLNKLININNGNKRYFNIMENKRLIYCTVFQLITN